MKNVSIKRTQLCFNYVVKVELEGITAEVIYQCWVGIHEKDNEEHGWKKGELYCDIEEIDYGKITFLGMEIKGWKNIDKFKLNLKSMGINFSNMVGDIADDKMTKEQVFEDNKEIIKLAFGKN